MNIHLMDLYRTVCGKNGPSWKLKTSTNGYKYYINGEHIFKIQNQTMHSFKYWHLGPRETEDE